MDKKQQIVEAAINAYRACCNGQGTTILGSKFDCRIDFDKQVVNVTDECGTVVVSMYDADFRKGT